LRSHKLIGCGTVHAAICWKQRFIHLLLNNQVPQYIIIQTTRNNFWSGFVQV